MSNTPTTLAEVAAISRALELDDLWGYCCWLYRYFDEDGELLYIGITSHIYQRDQNHWYRGFWRSEARTIQVELFPSKYLAEIAEAIAIREHKPRHNLIYPNHTIECAVARSCQWYLKKHGGNLVGEHQATITLRRHLPDE